MNSPINPHSHSPCIYRSTTLGGKMLQENQIGIPQNTLNPDPCTRLIGRANEKKIMVNGKSVTALLDTGSQVIHISQDYCQAMGIFIHPITQLVHIEGTGGHYRICRLHWGKIIFSNGDPCVWDWAPPTGPAHYRISEEGAVAIGTSCFDMAVDSLGTLDQSKLSTLWKNVCCATQSRRKVQE